jgi:hypothetical protein
LSKLLKKTPRGDDGDFRAFLRALGQTQQHYPFELLGYTLNEKTNLRPFFFLPGQHKEAKVP